MNAKVELGKDLLNSLTITFNSEVAYYFLTLQG